jgi:CRP-like cAMP-binding protein
VNDGWTAARRPWQSLCCFLIIASADASVDADAGRDTRSERLVVMQSSTKLDLRAALDVAATPYSVASYRPKDVIFLQGDASASVVYVEHGSVRLTVTAPNGKEATLGLLGPGSFLGEEVLAGQAERPETATAVTSAGVIEIAKVEMIRRLGTPHVLSERFIAHMLARHIRLEADLIDQLFNSCEKRVARTLLLLAGCEERNQPQALPPISQEVIAEMVGTTRSRVNLFMNKFKRLGFIEYSDGLKINPSLMNVVLD